MSDVQPFKDAHAKALSINLDLTSFGSFAEIGGGQEVARWFLTVGGASGTVAKTICAYDKTFSDNIYGAGTRYVSRERLRAMLDHEYQLLVERLGPTRGDKTRFFVFADTVATRNYKGDNDQHGWIGIRYQSEPLAKPNEILLHVDLLDPSAAMQQDLLGLLGVNLVYGAFFTCQSPDSFLECISQGIAPGRMEVDVVDFSGPSFEARDAAEWNLKLLRRNLASALMFDPEGKVVEPSTFLRKRPLVVDRGRFETLETFHESMFASADGALRAEGKPLVRDPQHILEMALHPVTTGETPDDAAILARLKTMLRLGPALLSNLPEGYRLVPYFRRFTSEPIRFVGGITQMARMMQERFYEELPGNMLEGLGKLFASNVTYYLYPMPREAVIAALGPDVSKKLGVLDSTAKFIGADDLIAPSPIQYLYRYLREAGRIVPIELA